MFCSLLRKRGFPSTKVLFENVPAIVSSVPVKPNTIMFSRCYNQLKLSNKKYTPRRAVMYVPGDDQKKLNKIASVKVDCAILECEDGVALNRKDDARKGIRKVLDDPNFDFGVSECAVRVNAPNSGLADDDLGMVLTANRLPSTIFFPKVETVEEIEWISVRLERLLKMRNASQKMNVIIYMESAVSLLNLKDICQRAIELSKTRPFHLDGLVFGSDDFLADIGATRTENAHEVIAARQLMLATAKAFKIHAIDMVYIDYKNLEGLRNECIEGARMGFTGKQVIHPGQVEVVQKSFLPSVEKVKWARELISLFVEHQKLGKGAFTFHGAMIDRPLLLQAQNIVELADSVSFDSISQKISTSSMKENVNT